MKINVVIANPANNITAFVLNDIEKKDYISIAQKLMNKKEFNIEQVGFVKEPIIGGELRLEMMGGEFCGNATRSFGLYLAKCKGLLDSGSVNVEITGCNTTLNVETNVMKEKASVSMPLMQRLEKISIDADSEFYLVVFEGIIHVIIENKDIDNHLIENVKKVLMEKYNPDALGVMFLNIKDISMKPVVYVRDTNSLIYESSCGSGTVAAAIYLCRNENEGVFTYEISQPGGIITSKIIKKDGIVKESYIDGKVTLSDEIVIEI